MKVMFWIMKTKSKKSKLDCSLFIDNVYVFFSSWICVTLYSLFIFIFFLFFFFFWGGLFILVNLYSRDSNENEEKW